MILLLLDPKEDVVTTKISKLYLYNEYILEHKNGP